MRSLFVCSLLLFIFPIQDSLATHIRAGEITAELVSCQGLTYRITITGYEDTESGLVYTYDSDEHMNREDRLYNYWDGMAEGRGLVSVGIYFYHAEVEFLVLDPNRKSRTYKGWVHVMYDNAVGR